MPIRDDLILDGQRDQPRLLLVATVAATLRAFLLPIARHFQQQGWRVDAVATGVQRDQSCQSTFDCVWGADWSRNPLAPANLVMVKRIRKLVLDHGYHLVHVHTPVASFVTRFALDPLRLQRKVAVLYTAHGLHFHPMGSSIRNRAYEILERQAAKWTDFMVVINREDLKTLKDKKLIPSDRLRHMPGIGVDRMRYSPSSVPESDMHRIHAELGIDDTTPVLLMVAEFVRRKRHEDAIRAFSKVLHPRAKLVLAGTGPLLEPMKRLAARLGVASQVQFVGHRDDVPALMKASRALVLPSSQEGLPMCVIEALSMALPVIGSRIRGTAELLERNAGLLVNVGDIDEMAHAMQRMVDDPFAAAAMGRVGRRQSELYDLKHILRMHEELYEQAFQLLRPRTCDWSSQTEVLI